MKHDVKRVLHRTQIYLSCEHSVKLRQGHPIS